MSSVEEVHLSSMPKTLRDRMFNGCRAQQPNLKRDAFEQMLARTRVSDFLNVTRGNRTLGDADLLKVLMLATMSNENLRQQKHKKSKWFTPKVDELMMILRAYNPDATTEQLKQAMPSFDGRPKCKDRDKLYKMLCKYHPEVTRQEFDDYIDKESDEDDEEFDPDVPSTSGEPSK